MSSHKGKAVKTLIDERLAGKHYIRVSAKASSSTSLQLQRSTNVVLQSFLDSRLGPSLIAKPIIKQEATLARPQIPNVKYRSPTLLQKLNPISNRLKEEGMLDQAIEEVQTLTQSLSPDLISVPRPNLVPDPKSESAASSAKTVFSRTPRTIAAMMR